MERFFNPEPAPAPAPAPTPAPARYRQGVAQAQPDAAASLLGAPPAGRGPERVSSAAVTGTLLATDVVQVGAELHVGCERQRPS